MLKFKGGSEEEKPENETVKESADTQEEYQDIVVLWLLKEETIQSKNNQEW